MSAIEKRDPQAAAMSKIESVLMAGDLSKLTAEERVNYYQMVCQSVGLNPLTKPLEYITLNSKLTLYARKDCTDQLRSINQVSVTIVAREVVDDCYVVTARATLPSGRTDESIGAVSIANLKGEAKCNALMKSETKAKRRVTLSICGMGLLDESELETIPTASLKEVKTIDQDIQIAGPRNRETNGGQISSGEAHVVAGEAVGSGGASSPSTAPAESVECSTPEQQDYMRMRFRDSLAMKHKTRADELRREWLRERGYVGEDGQGTSKKIPRATFTSVCKEAIKYAKSLE